MLRHLSATASRLLSSACLARARAIVSAASPCSAMRFRAARATSRSVAMSDPGARGDRFANKNLTASLPQAATAPLSYCGRRSTTFDNTPRHLGRGYGLRPAPERPRQEITGEPIGPATTAAVEIYRRTSAAPSGTADGAPAPTAYEPPRSRRASANLRSAARLFRFTDAARG
jgi:hypothetical protein